MRWLPYWFLTLMKRPMSARADTMHNLRVRSLPSEDSKGNGSDTGAKEMVNSSEPHRTESSPAATEHSTEQSSPLASLRGRVTTAKLRELGGPKRRGLRSEDQAGDQSKGKEHGTAASPVVVMAVPDKTLEEPPRRLSSLRGLVTHAELQELHTGKQQLDVVNGKAEQSSADVERALDASESKPRLAGKPESGKAVSSAAEAVKDVEAPPNTDPPVPSQVLKSVAQQRSGAIEDVLTLPSKRGQYRQKK